MGIKRGDDGDRKVYMLNGGTEEKEVHSYKTIKVYRIVRWFPRDEVQLSEKLKIISSRIRELMVDSPYLGISTVEDTL
jgi:hypothetical protein